MAGGSEMDNNFVKFVTTVWNAYLRNTIPCENFAKASEMLADVFPIIGIAWTNFEKESPMINSF